MGSVFSGCREEEEEEEERGDTRLLVGDEIGWGRLPQTPPAVERCGGSDRALLSDLALTEIRRALPPDLQGFKWRKVFSSSAHSTLEDLNRKLAQQRCLVIAARVNCGSLMGMFVELEKPGWKVLTRQTGEPHQMTKLRATRSFVFRLPPRHDCDLDLRKRRKRVSSNNSDSDRPLIADSTFLHAKGEAQLLCGTAFLALGTSEHAFWLDEDMTQGGSDPSKLFGMGEPLCETSLFFDVLHVEAWGLHVFT